jgi:multidrug efflux pump subunit AcrB
MSIGAREGDQCRTGPAKLSANGLTVADLRNSLQSANSGMPGGELVAGNRSIQVDAGEFYVMQRALVNW